MAKIRERDKSFWGAVLLLVLAIVLYATFVLKQQVIGTKIPEEMMDRASLGTYADRA
jgi:hypothetical protein